MSRYVKPFFLFFLIIFPSLAMSDEKADSDLVYKASFGRGEEIKTLVEVNKANPNAINKQGVPALSIAALRKDAEGFNVMKHLMIYKANINQKDPEGQTPLFYAAKAGNLDGVKLLLYNGAEYYSTDSKGEVARTYAYVEGHQQVFQFMDKFVEDQRSAVYQKYQNYNKEVEARYKAMLKQKDEELKHQRAINEQLIEQQQEQYEETATPADNEHFQQLVHDYAYNVCAMQYWSYVRNVKVTNDKGDTLDNVISKHQSTASDISAVMAKDYNTDAKYIKRIQQPTEERITTELKKYGSNATLSSYGVGTEADVKKRCEDIAKIWQISTEASAEEPQQQKKKRGGSKGSGNKQHKNKKQN